MRWFLVTCFCAVGAVSVAPQAQPYPCPPGLARATLQGVDVRATLYTNGNLFFGGSAASAGYRVPLTVEPGQSVARSPLYAANLWLAGIVGGEIRAAAAAYESFAFHPGIAGADRTPPSEAECEAADRIWTVSVFDVDRYTDTGFATPDLAGWPVHLGARVVDGDGVAGNYNLAGGDRPALSGDVTAFWAMTDTATRNQFPGFGIGVDVQTEAFVLRSAIEAMQTTTFYRYTFTNRSGLLIDSLHAGLFMDYDLGNAADDYLGTDTTLAMAYVYNADDDDEGFDGYGLNPPAFGTLVLAMPDGLDGQPAGLGATQVIFGSPPPFNEPYSASDYYNRMRGRLNDGTRIREGGEGGQGVGGSAPSPVTTYYFAGDPVTEQFWSERNIDRNGSSATPGDLKGMLATGAFSLAPDSSATVLFAFVYGRGSSHLNSIEVLRRNAQTVRNAQRLGLLNPRAAALPPPPDAPPLALSQATPNPFATDTALRLRGLPATLDLQLRVVDVLGRVVEQQTIRGGSTEVRVGRGLAAGVYIVEVSAPGLTVTRTIVKAD